MLTIAPEHCAVLAVDMQNDFCHHDGHYGRAGADISGLLAAVGPVSRLIAKARTAGAAVAYTRLVYDEAAGLMEDRHAIKPRHWLPSGQRLRQTGSMKLTITGRPRSDPSEIGRPS